MPRKFNYGVDYDDGYDDDYYEDYDEDEYDTRHNGEASESKGDANKQQPVWRCAICTYDNEEGMNACDICGVIRNPVHGDFKNSDKGRVDDRCKGYGVSKMAESLFALPLPNRTPQKAVVGQLQSGDVLTEEGNDFHKHRNFQGNFVEFHKAFSSHSHSHFDIAAFKFDVPSPDDMVSNGLHSSKMGSKANFPDITSSRVSSGIANSTTAVNVQSTAKRTDCSSLLATKGKQFVVDEGNNSANRKSRMLSSSNSSDKSSASVSKSGQRGISESKDSENSLLVSSGIKPDSLSATINKGKHRSIEETSAFSDKEDYPDSVTSSLTSMTLSNKSGNSSSISKQKTKSPVQYQPEKWMLPDKAGDAMTQLNLAIVGHVDSGKSTLSGRLLHLLGRITQKNMHKYEKEAKLQGKGSFAYAWALDESPEERERGITMTVAVAYFDTKRHHVVVLDSPGHKDFVPNMISGAAQADAAILVIDASVGAFEVGLDASKGQTREHAQLIRSFGVDQIIVAVNKMDAVAYSNDRFDLIKTQLGTFLRTCNFKDSSVTWIPLSAMDNQNLVAAPTDVRLSSWYNGPCLLDAIDGFQPPTREFAKPLILPICDVIKSSSQGQVSASGKLEAGALRSGFRVLVMPSGDIGTVRSLERDSQACTVARAGDNVFVTLQGIDASNVMSGGVICHPDFPVAVAKHLELRVLILDGANPILIGSQLEFHIHHAKEAARVAKIVSLLDPKTGKVTKKNPRCVLAKQSAVMEVVLSDPVCVHEFSSCRALGRAFLRTLGRTIGLGIVTKIIEDQE